jgi:hypothetical protein
MTTHKCETIPFSFLATEIEEEPEYLGCDIYKHFEVVFTANVIPKVGDWIMRASASDCFHVPNAMFRKRCLIND